jgi:hypothetical protein
MHGMPSYGKALCRLYMDKGRTDEAIGVASTCYASVRDNVTGFPPVGPAFRPALQTWLLWAEICGNVYEKGGQRCMARMVYEVTLQDLKRFHWDSPVTQMYSRDQTHYTDIFKRKLERLGPDSDDEEGDEEEPPIPSERQLRLALLKPAVDPTAPVEVTTCVVDIEKAPSYLALSYAWGNSRKVISYTREDGPPYADEADTPTPTIATGTILLDGKELSVRQTLRQALQVLRQRESETTIWVDALCTSTDEMKRRAAWALRMRNIYQKAAEVVVWLGQGEEDTRSGMEYWENFCEESYRGKIAMPLGDLSESLFGSKSSVPWEGIYKILRSEWWTRIWTLQEFIVAKELSIRCGDKMAPWDNLADFTSFVIRHSRTYQCCAALEPHVWQVIDLVKEREEYINLRDKVRIKSGYPLEKLWQITKRHESWDPRDKIFALIGLVDRTSAKYVPKVNYDFCACAAYSDMIVFRNIEPKALSDGALAHSRITSAVLFLGLEQGTEEALEHTYTWDSKRVDEKCDGEKCGRRLKCFSTNSSSIRPIGVFTRCCNTRSGCMTRTSK